MKSLISKKRLTEEEEERRWKQSLDSPQTIEANKNGEFKNKGFRLGIFFNIDQTHYTSNSKLYDLFFNSEAESI